MKNDRRFRRATSEEIDDLGDLAFRSKAVWGYSEDFMNSCRDELAVDAELVLQNRVWVAEDSRGILGFYSLEDLPTGDIELGHLFVEPERIKSGIGSLLLDHACRTACDLGFQRLVIQGDPNAERFYLRCGATRIGDRESASIPGRRLPLFEMDLTQLQKI